MTSKKTSKKINSGGLKCSSIYPLTDAQADAFHFYSKDKNLILYGSAGTGKTYISIGLGILDVLNKDIVQDKLVIVRSCVPSRDVGFLPGSLEEKSAIYELPYKQICSELFSRGDSYEILKQKNVINFITTSFVRGITLNNSIVIVDEFQNLTIEEIHTIMTRLGDNSRIIFCGDTKQTDFGIGGKKQETSGFSKLLSIASQIDSFTNIEFFQEDIVRSELVKDWIIAKEKIDLRN